MRTLILSIATAASALAIAAPASAQYYPQPQQQRYGAPYGNAYGYNNYGQVRRLDARIDQLQREIRRLDARNIISEREADRLRQQSRELEARLRYVSRNGFTPYEANQIERGIARLEQRIRHEAFDRNGRYGNQWGQNGWSDRDRDGRDDRYENDRGRDHDDD
jgi:TolA-binding protein